MSLGIKFCMVCIALLLMYWIFWGKWVFLVLGLM